MKNFFIPLAICMLIHVSIHARPGNSKLKVREIDHRIILVQLNQGPTSQPSDAVYFDNLIAGTYHIRVWVKKGPRRTDEFALAYNGPLHVPANSDVRTIIHRNGQLKVFEVIPLYPAPQVFCGSNLIGPCGVNFQSGMEDGAFQHLLIAIDHATFDQTRLQLARQAIVRHGRIKTAQVELIIGRLSFESSRLALAKQAYPFTVDPANYPRLFPSFCFDSSIRELSQFIYGGGV